DVVGDPSALIFLRPRRSDQQLSTLLVQTAESLEHPALGVFRLLPRRDVELNTLVPVALPCSSRETTDATSWSHTIRPSLASIRYSILNGSPASTDRVVSPITSSRSSGCTASIHSDGFAIHSSDRKPSTSSIWGLTNSSTTSSRLPLTLQTYTMAGICSTRVLNLVSSSPRSRSSRSDAFVSMVCEASLARDGCNARQPTGGMIDGSIPVPDRSRSCSYRAAPASELEPTSSRATPTKVSTKDEACVSNQAIPCSMRGTGSSNERNTTPGASSSASDPNPTPINFASSATIEMWAVAAISIASTTDSGSRPSNRTSCM